MSENVTWKRKIARLKNKAIKSMIGSPVGAPVIDPVQNDVSIVSVNKVDAQELKSAFQAGVHSKYEIIFKAASSYRIKVISARRDFEGLVLELEGFGERGYFLFNENIVHAFALKKDISEDPVKIELVRSDISNSYIKLCLDAWALKELGYKDEAIDLWRSQENFSGSGFASQLLFERAHFVRGVGLYDDQVTVDFESAFLNASPENLRNSDIMRWGDYIWYTQGTDTRSREIYEIVRGRSPTPMQKLRIASFYADAGDYLKCVDVFRELQRSKSDLHLKHRYMGLSHFLFSEGLSKNGAVKADYDLFNRLRRNDGAFERIVKRYSVAVVGSSPNQIGTGSGASIDNHDYVVRFNQARPDHIYSKDYGKKFNIWVKSNANLFVKRQPRNQDIDLAIMFDGGLYCAKGGYYRHIDMANEYSVQLIPRTVFFDVVSKIKRQPSLGLQTVYWMSLLRGGLRDQENIFGISLNDQGQNQTVHYYEPDKKISGHRHDWEAERELFDEIIAQ